MEVCESLCFLCPDLRTRSRHPVKRYKKLLAEIFPKSQITVYLEQKFFKELRAERFGSVNVVMAIYRKIDSTYMFNLESQIPKLCHLAQELDMILDIIEVTSRLTEHSKAQSSTAIMSAISDMVRHLGKSMQSLDSDAGAGDDNKWNNRYRKAVDECLVQLSRKVGDAGPILDTLAVVLENISSTTPVARSTISAAYRTAQIIASLPNLTYKSKADPFLRLVEDLRLQSLDSAAYGSKEDDDLALKSLSHINMNDQSKQIAVSIILDSLELSESELNTARNQLFEDFSADDVCPIGSHFIASPSKSPAYNAKMHQKSLEVIPMGFVFEDDTFVEPDSLGEPQSRNPSDNSLLDVNQLLESVLETSRNVGRLSVSTNHDLTFKDVANQCEALLIGKQKKLSVCMSAHQQEVGELSNRKLESSEPDSPTDELIPLTNNDQCYSNFCKLPVLNPYDKFLTSAGC
ncbi:hypothetical protein ACQ4PT_070716 [Festuca glaucescens]